MKPPTLREWFLNALKEYRAGKPALPAPWFRLYPWVTVTGDRFYDQLEIEILHSNANPDNPHPRIKSGALENDLRQLYKIAQTRNL